MPERAKTFTIDDPKKIPGFIHSVEPLCHLDWLDPGKIKLLVVAAPKELPTDFPEGPHDLSNRILYVATGTSFERVNDMFTYKSETHDAHTSTFMIRRHGTGQESVSAGTTVMGRGHGLDDFLDTLVRLDTAWLAIVTYDSELKGDVLTLYRSRSTSPIRDYPEVAEWFALREVRIQYDAFCGDLPTPRRAPSTSPGH